MRTVKYIVTEPFGDHNEGDIIDVPLILEGLMNDGLVLLWDDTTATIETVDLHEDGYWRPSSGTYVNIDNVGDKIESFINALKILA